MLYEGVRRMECCLNWDGWDLWGRPTTKVSISKVSFEAAGYVKTFEIEFTVKVPFRRPGRGETAPVRAAIIAARTEWKGARRSR